MPLSVKEALDSRKTPSEIKLRKFLESCPPDKVFTPEEVMDACGMRSTNTLYLASRRSDFSEHRFFSSRGKKSYWGSKTAIKALRKALEG